MEEWQGISIEEISKWENYAALRNQSEPDYKTLGTIWVYLDATTMTGTTDEEEYKMYEEVFQKEMGGQAFIYVYLFIFFAPRISQILTDLLYRTQIFLFNLSESVGSWWINPCKVTLKC